MEAVEAMVGEIDFGLRNHGTRERARSEKAYLKSELDHYGTRVPDIRAAVSSATKRQTISGRDELRAAAEALWAVPVHERRMATVELLVLRVDLLDVGDILLVERLVRESRTWALVDHLAEKVMGSLVERYPEAGTVLDRWSVDDDFWIRRAALLALLRPLRRGDGDFERFSRYADAMLDETEFFIRKAIGWVLRDTAKKRPDLVFDWLLPRAARASRVTLREAVKPLSDDQRAAVHAAGGMAGRR